MNIFDFILYRKGYKYVFLLIATLIISACSSLQVGHDFDINTFTKGVKTGVTTKVQVKNWLGEPVSSGVSVDKDGVATEEWMYFYGSGQLPKMNDTKIKVLQIHFDKNDKVSSYNWSKSKDKPMQAN